METVVGAYAIWWILLLILGVLWFFLPFAVFGTKPKIDELIEEARTTNQLLKEIKESLKPSS